MTTLAISLFSWTAVLLPVQTGVPGARPAQEPAPAWVAEQLDLALSMRDGKQLSGDLFLPAEEGRYPCVLIQTPYDKSHLRAAFQGKLEDAKGTSAVGRGAISDILVLKDREHYAYVVVDWRGFFGSKVAAQGVARLGPVRARDGFDTVEWIAAQPWSNGRVGTWGGSALGKQQFSTAIEQPPHLVCAVPAIASMGISYDQYFEGGVPLDAHLKILDFLGFGLRQRVLGSPEPSSPLWDVARRFSYRPERIQVPCLLITGWWDNYPDAVIATFEDLCRRGGAQCREHSRLLIGPWDHVGLGLREQGVLEFPQASEVSGRAAKAFLDYHLRGIGEALPERVRYFDSGSQKWKSCDAWTALPRVIQRFELCADGSLSPRATADQASSVDQTEAGSRSYRYDPTTPPPTLGGRNLPPLPHGPRLQNALLDREDVLVYQTAVLREPLELQGRAKLTVSFEADRVDLDFCPLLCDVDEKGQFVLLAETAQRASLAGARRTRLDPAEIHRLEITFPSHSHRFAEGHRLALILASGNSPRYERNPHNGQPLWKDEGSLDLHVEILHGGEHRSWLSLPKLR